MLITEISQDFYAWSSYRKSYRWAVLGLVALVIAVMSALFLWLRSRMRMYNLGAGALGWWAFLMVLSSMFFPGGSYLFT